MTALVVVPAAPLLLPGAGQETPPGVEPVLAACDEILAAALPADGDVTVVATADHMRDLVGDPVRTRDCMGHRVAGSLLDRVGHTGVRVSLTATGGMPQPEGGTWVFVCDGSASVGQKSPRPGPVGAQVDELISAALAEGDLAALGTLDDTLAAAAGCTTAAVWRALASVGSALPTAMVSHAPYGVTYFVARLDSRA